MTIAFGAVPFEACTPTSSQREAFKQAMEMISGKWKMDIIFALLTGEPTRFGVLRRKLPGITQHMLSSQLRALEADGMVLRQVYPEVPPRVEYTITRKAYALGPVLLGLVDWVEWSRMAENAGSVSASSERVD